MGEGLGTMEGEGGVGVQLIPPKVGQGETATCFTHIRTHSPSSVDSPVISPVAWAGLHRPLRPPLRGHCLAVGWPGARWGH